MLKARSVRVWLICGAIAICLAISGQAQDVGTPQEAERPSTSSAKGQDKCCASTVRDSKPGGEQAAPKLSAEELFTARARMILGSGQPAKGDWGLLIADGGTGQVLFEENADKYFVPASNMKLFTTALALAKLSPDFRFRTTLEATAEPNAAGKLEGPLYLVGRGDPNLSNRKFPYMAKEEFDGPSERVIAEMANALAAKVIKEISGDVIGDESYFPRERYPNGWEIDDMVWEYGAAISAIVVDDNVVTLTLTPGEHAGDPEEPAQHAAASLKRLLEERGVKVSGAAKARHDRAEPGGDPAVLAEHVSVPLVDAVKLINKISQNLHAEMLLRTAARQNAVWATPDELMKVPADFYAAAGIAPGDVIQADASGLSRHDLVTPRAIATLLGFAQKQSWFGLYYASLPVAGVDGTLEDRMKNTLATGRIHAKTGSVQHVRTLSG